MKKLFLTLIAALGIVGGDMPQVVAWCHWTRLQWM